MNGDAGVGRIAPGGRDFVCETRESLYLRFSIVESRGRLIRSRAAAENKAASARVSPRARPGREPAGAGGPRKPSAF